RKRAQPRPPHQSVGVAFVKLIQHSRAAGHERRAGDRLRHRRRVDRPRGAEVVPGRARGDDEKIQPRLRQRDVVADDAGGAPWFGYRQRCGARADLFHARASSLRIADCGLGIGDCGLAIADWIADCPIGTPESAIESAIRNPQSAMTPRHVRSASTRDVASTRAPQTTWMLLIQGSRRLRTVSAPSVICIATSATSSDAGRVNSRRSRNADQTYVAVPAIPSVTTSAPTRCAKWIAIFASQWSGTT